MNPLRHLALRPRALGITTLTAFACWAALSPPSAYG